MRLPHLLVILCPALTLAAPGMTPRDDIPSNLAARKAPPTFTTSTGVTWTDPKGKNDCQQMVSVFYTCRSEQAIKDLSYVVPDKQFILESVQKAASWCAGVTSDISYISRYDGTSPAVEIANPAANVELELEKGVALCPAGEKPLQWKFMAWRWDNTPLNGCSEPGPVMVKARDYINAAWPTDPPFFMWYAAKTGARIKCKRGQYKPDAKDMRLPTKKNNAFVWS